MLRVFSTHRASNHHWRFCIVVTQIKWDLHAGIPAPNNKHFLSCKTLSGFILTSMHDTATELSQPFKLRHHFLRVFAGGNHKPPANVLNLTLSSRNRGGSFPSADGLDPPQAKGLIVLGRLHCFIELWGYVEVGGVGLKVAYELKLCGVLGEVLREREVRKLAELFGEVKLEAIVGAVLPERSNAVCSLQDYEWNTLVFESCSHCKTRRTSTYYHGSVHPNATPWEEILRVKVLNHWWHVQTNVMHFFFCCCWLETTFDVCERVLFRGEDYVELIDGDRGWWNWLLMKDLCEEIEREIERKERDL